VSICLYLGSVVIHHHEFSNMDTVTLKRSQKRRGGLNTSWMYDNCYMILLNHNVYRELTSSSTPLYIVWWKWLKLNVFVHDERFLNIFSRLFCEIYCFSHFCLICKLGWFWPQKKLNQWASQLFVVWNNIGIWNSIFVPMNDPDSTGFKFLEFKTCRKVNSIFDCKTNRFTSAKLKIWYSYLHSNAILNIKMYSCISLGLKITQIKISVKNVVDDFGT